MKQRSLRMAQVVRKITGEEIIDKLPHLKLAVTDVDVSDDLRHANVWVSTLTDSDDSDTEAKLREVRPQVQKRLADHLKTKFTPRVNFRLDHGRDHQRKIDELFKSL